MPINKKQLKRMIMFVASLRKEEYPNRVSFVKKLEQNDIDHNENVCCSVKTIQRDVKTLIDEFGAPIEFDKENNGYFLTRKDWKFRCPVFQDDELLALAIGARVASKIFPAPISTDIQDAFDYQLAENNYDGGFDHLEQLMISSGLNVDISPSIFNKVYSSWKDRYCIKIVYSTASNDESERIIEPQLLIFHERAWLIKAFCHQQNEARNFAIHRIKSVEILSEQFKYRKGFSAEEQTGSIYNFKKVDDVTIKCNNSILPYILEQPLHNAQEIIQDTDYFILKLPEIIESHIIQWVLKYMGEATITEPMSLRNQVANHAKELLSKHTD